MPNKLKVNISEVLSFFDECPKDSRRHATAIVSVLGEDLGVSLLQSCLEQQFAVTSTVVTENGIPRTPTPGASGARLDRWLLANPAGPEKRRLYQVEIKNWSAHAIGGREIPNGRRHDEAFLKAYRIERWHQVWNTDLDCFRWPECGKVLTQMYIPKLNDNAEGNPSGGRSPRSGIAQAGGVVSGIPGSVRAKR